MADDSSARLDAMTRAVADLWSQVIRTGDDFVIFHDHWGNAARVRYEAGVYRIAWVVEVEGEPRWNEILREFDDPREAAFHAFQGPSREG